MHGPQLTLWTSPHQGPPVARLPTAQLTQLVVVGKVEFADFQESAVLGQAPHAGLQLLFRQRVQNQVDTLGGRWGKDRSSSSQHWSGSRGLDLVPAQAG